MPHSGFTGGKQAGDALGGEQQAVPQDRSAGAGKEGGKAHAVATHSLKLLAYAALSVFFLVLIVLTISVMWVMPAFGLRNWPVLNQSVSALLFVGTCGVLLWIFRSHLAETQRGIR